MAILDRDDIQNIISQFDRKKHKKDHSMQIDEVLVIAVSSAIGGALLGILFAPEKGKKTRKNLALKRDQYFEKIKKGSGELSKQLKNNTDSILEKSSRTVQNIKEGAEDYSEWTFQELYDHAKELKIKGYSQMNKSELVQAIESH